MLAIAMLTGVRNALKYRNWQLIVLTAPGPGKVAIFNVSL